MEVTFVVVATKEKAQATQQITLRVPPGTLEHEFLKALMQDRLDWHSTAWRLSDDVH